MVATAIRRMLATAIKRMLSKARERMLAMAIIRMLPKATKRMLGKARNIMLGKERTLRSQEIRITSTIRIIMELPIKNMAKAKVNTLRDANACHSFEQWWNLSLINKI